MTYHIKKIVNGNAHILHRHISTIDLARDTLKCIATAEKRNKNKVKLYAWQININNNSVIYQLEKD